MSSEPILICYDGSQSAEHSFRAAAALLAVAEHSRRPVLIVTPPDEHRSSGEPSHG